MKSRKEIIKEALIGRIYSLNKSLEELKDLGDIGEIGNKQQHVFQKDLHEKVAEAQIELLNMEKESVYVVNNMVDQYKPTKDMPYVHEIFKKDDVVICPYCGDDNETGEHDRTGSIEERFCYGCKRIYRIHYREIIESVVAIPKEESRCGCGEDHECCEGDGNCGCGDEEISAEDEVKIEGEVALMEGDLGEY